MGFRLYWGTWWLYDEVKRMGCQWGWVLAVQDREGEREMGLCVGKEVDFVFFFVLLRLFLYN